MNHFALNGVISPQELYYYALRAVAMLIVIPFHESAHALISWKLGDSTAKDMGRLSMNPLRHFDPLGALCMIAAGVGWAKPVGINPTRFKNPKRGMAVSAAAGPLSNFLLAYAAMLLYKVVYYACGGAAPQLVLDFLYVLISMNISLGVFNLIPVPPFDGSRIVLLFLPQKMYFQAMRYEKYIMGVKSYDALCEIAPVVFLVTDAEKGVVESTRENAMTIASIFGLEDHVEALMADFDSRIDALKAFAEGKTAIVGMTTSGSFNVLGNDGRCSIIGKEIGFENIGVDANIDTSTHGNEASFEFIVDKNPDYIFAMDRDAAIGTDGAQMAQEILENELVKSTDAYKNGHVVYLAHPNVWYTAEGGIQALSEMLSDLENALL